MVTLKGLHVHAQGVSLAQAGRELHLAMDEIVVPDEAADEADDDHGRHRAGEQIAWGWSERAQVTARKEELKCESTYRIDKEQLRVSCG